MLISTHIEVFDDEKYCHDGHGNKCPRLGSDYFCGAYDEGAVHDSKDTGLLMKCHECSQSYQKALKEKGEYKVKDGIDLLMSELFPGVEYESDFGKDLFKLVIKVKNYNPEIVQKAISKRSPDFFKIHVINSVDTGEECEFDCEKYGLPKDSMTNAEVCKKCPNTPPF